MNIQQLSNNIDQKLAQLEQQLTQLKAQLAAADGNSDQFHKDLAALELVKRKLQKSQAIMWQAHELQGASDQKRQSEKRLLGIALCVLSGVGLLALALLAITQ